MTTTLTASTRTIGVAKMLAAELEASPGPATLILENHLSRHYGTRYTLRLHVTGPHPHPGVRHRRQILRGPRRR